MTIESSSFQSGGQRLRLGMVGGGEGAFIGAVHRLAARMDDQYTLVAGALSADPAVCLRSGQQLGLAADRCYASYEAMAAAERARSDGVEVVAIVTPNHLHAPVARAFLQAGIHVVCDKPLCLNLDEALALRQQVKDSGLLFALTHNYTGYPMVRHARALVQAGRLGEIRLVQVEYPQDWLSEKLEDSGQKQAAWRTDPARAGAGGCLGDIGTHAFQLADFVTGIPVTELCAELSRFVDGRRLDDNVQMMLRYANGARGMLWASQVAVGHENGLKLRVYGSRASVEWVQADPNHLFFSELGQPRQTITRGSPAVGMAAQRMTRIPAGHPEGYLEGFANLYTEVALALNARRQGQTVPAEVQFPDIEDGVKGMAFIETAVQSSQQGGAWVSLQTL